MRTLEEVLKDLKEAEKEFADKCLYYGIEEKGKRKKKEGSEPGDSDKKDTNNKQA